VAVQRPIVRSEPAVPLETAEFNGAGLADARQRSKTTLCCHPPTAASGEPNYCIEGWRRRYSGNFVFRKNALSERPLSLHFALGLSATQFVHGFRDVLHRSNACK